MQKRDEARRCWVYPMCCTNMIELSNAQGPEVGFKFEPFGTTMKGKRNSKFVLYGDSKRTVISELPGMKSVSSGRPNVVFYNASRDDTMRLAHRLTCHMSVDTLRRMELTNVVYGLNIVKSTKDIGRTSEACVDGKAINKAHRRRDESSNEVVEFMPTDICGKTKSEEIDGKLYAQILTDDYSSAMWVSSMPQKSWMAKAARGMIFHARKSAVKKVSTIRTDIAKEFTLRNSKKLLEENCMVLDDTQPYSTQSNGRAERPNRMVFEKARTLLPKLNMSCKLDGYQKLWPKAIRCFFHVYIGTRSSHEDVREKAHSR